MKKVYKKPTIAFESFQLSQSIAACYIKLGSTTALLCETAGNTNEDGEIKPGGFTNDINCDYSLEGYCYTNGTSEYGTYMS